MKPIDYVILGVLTLIMVGIAVHLIKRKKSGKGGCGCGCANCPSAGRCHGAKEKSEDTDDETV